MKKQKIINFIYRTLGISIMIVGMMMGSILILIVGYISFMALFGDSFVQTKQKRKGDDM